MADMNASEESPLRRAERVYARHGFQVTHARSGEEALQALLPAGAPASVTPYGVILLAMAGYVTMRESAT